MATRVKGYTTRGGRRVGGYVRSGSARSVVRHSLSMNVVMHSVSKGRSKRYSGVAHAKKPSASGRVPRTPTTFRTTPQRKGGAAVLMHTHDRFGRALDPPIPFGKPPRQRKGWLR